MSFCTKAISTLSCCNKLIFATDAPVDCAEALAPGTFLFKMSAIAPPNGKYVPALPPVAILMNFCAAGFFSSFLSEPPPQPAAIVAKTMIAIRKAKSFFIGSPPHF